MRENQPILLNYAVITVSFKSYDVPSIFIWGAFFVTMGAYLLQVFEGEDSLNTIIGSICYYNWAGLLAPVFVGLLADRYFNAEKVNGISHLVGAVLLWTAAGITEPGTFIWVMLAYFMLYMPSLALVNAIAFANIDDPDSEFESGMGYNWMDYCRIHDCGYCIRFYSNTLS